MQPEPGMQHRLIGAWTLVSWKYYGHGNAPATDPYGREANGLLQYSADGYMSAVVSASQRSLLPPGISPRRLQPALLADCFCSYFHYAGRWRIESDCVIHSVEQALNPNLVGTEQVRQMSIEGTTLTLTGIESLGQTERRHVLIWRRAIPASGSQE